MDGATGGTHALCMPSCPNDGFDCSHAAHPVRGGGYPTLSKFEVP